MPSNCAAGEDTWESLGQQEDQTSQSWRKSTLSIHWKDWCWRWSSNTLATWCEEPTHWKKRWCWERLKAEGEKGKRGWDGWMASLTQRTWVWVNFRSWWWTGKIGMLLSMVLQRIGHGWATELYWFCELQGFRCICNDKKEFGDELKERKESKSPPVFLFEQELGKSYYPLR